MLLKNALNLGLSFSSEIEYDFYQILNLSSSQFLIKRVNNIENYNNQNELFYSKDSNYTVTLICTINNQINIGYIKSPLGKMIKFKETFLTYQEFKSNNNYMFYLMLYLYNKDINDFIYIDLYINEKIYEISTLGDELFIFYNNMAKKYYIDKEHNLKEKNIDYMQMNYPFLSESLNLYFFSNNKNYFKLICKNNNKLYYNILFDQNLKIIESLELNSKIPRKCYSIKDKIFLIYEENGFENGVQKYLQYINIFEILNYGKYPFKNNKIIKRSNIKGKENNLFDQNNITKEPIPECFSLLEKKKAENYRLQFNWQCQNFSPM